MEEGNSASKHFKLPKLNGSVLSGIFSIGFLEQCSGLFYAGSLLEEGSFTVNLFYLFRLEILLGL